MNEPSPPEREAPPVDWNNDGIEAGSFRDRNGRVFYMDNAVYRALSLEALKNWELLSSKEFFHRLLADRKVVQTERVESENIGDLPNVQGWAGYLRHETIPLVSYPYEWSFGMLKDAALLHLELLMVALEEGMTLKDASGFNVQWRGARPVFIDVPSFQSLSPGEPWVAYQQFCEMFLYPLFLQAYKNVPFHPWLRGRIDGIEGEELRKLMSLRDLFRRGVFTHLYLQARMQTRFADSNQDIKRELRKAGFSQQLVKVNVRNLSNLVQDLKWKQPHSPWSHYADENDFTGVDGTRKEDFVRRVVGARRRKLVWDLGSNTGAFSRIASENADLVIAMDSDHLAIERLYLTLRDEGNTTIHPLLYNIADPSPRVGWRLLERKSLTDRGKPDLTICLALLHHLVIGANIPLHEIVGWLRALGTELVIEFVTKEDAMVKKLLLNKADDYADYELPKFEHWLSNAFTIKRRETLPTNSRILYHALPKLA